MKNKLFAFVLALLLIGATNAWATVNDLGVPGGHVGNHGCFLCHAPHTKGAIQAAVTTGHGANSGLAGSALGLSLGAGVTAPATFSMASVGNPDAGTVFLWANPLTQATYTTWEGTTISAAGLTTLTPAIHSILCLSCHDSSMGTHDMSGTSLGGCGTAGCTGAGATTGNVGYTPPAMNGVGQVFWTNNTTNNGWASVGSLQATHPVDVAWPTSGAYWIVNVSGTTATFKDVTFALGDGNLGHPAKLYVQGGTAYVECTSCHEPHRYSQYAYQVGGVWTFGTTVDYIRGPYAAGTNGSEAAMFCRSCHYEKSMNYITAGGAPQ
jgi:hypothetical protein